MASAILLFHVLDLTHSVSSLSSPSLLHLHHELGSSRCSQHLPKWRTNRRRVKALDTFVNHDMFILNQIIPKM